MRKRGAQKAFVPSRWVAALLAGALGLAILLAWEAQDAARSHRRAAEGVLSDYARFAAAEFLRRARSEVDHYALYPVIYVLSAHERGHPGGQLPRREEIPSLAKGMGHGPLPAKTFFRLDPATGAVSSSPGSPPELAAWAAAKLPSLCAARSGLEGDLDAAPVEVGGTPRVVVYGASPDAARICLAFEIDTRDLAPFLERAFAEAPLLPVSSANSGGGSTFVSLELADAWGRALLRKGSAFNPEFGVEETLIDPGVFREMKLKASIPASAAETLVAGGLPRSRLPLVLATLVLAAGLLAAAIVLARKERALSSANADFVSAVSHELRTPLAQIRLFAETLLLERTRSGEERRRSLAIIDQEARRLTNLVENTLEFTRAERGTIALDLAEHDVSRIVRDSIDAFSPLAAARGVRIAAKVPESVFARVDAGALRQVLLNLLDNAVKYGPPGQEVLVALEPEADSLRLFVEDRGPGVPAADRERVFEKFTRLQRDRHSHAGGAGIGLWVVRELALLHGGRVRVEDAAGGGSRFSIELPATPATETAAAADASA
jgi:signal transduction histidine kinase